MRVSLLGAGARMKSVLWSEYISTFTHLETNDESFSQFIERTYRVKVILYSGITVALEFESDQDCTWFMLKV